MKAQPLFRLFVEEPELPLDLCAFPQREGQDGQERVPTLDFTFSYHAILFKGRYEAVEGGAGLWLEAVLGPVPFSAESPVGRAALLAVVAAADRHLGGALQIRAGRIVVERAETVVPPLSAVSLVVAIVRALAPVKPYLDLVATYVAPPGEKQAGGAVRPMWRRQPPRRLPSLRKAG